MVNLSSLRVAWLLPLMGSRSLYWQPVLREFTKTIPHTVVFTGSWSGYTLSCEGAFAVRLVGKTRLVPTGPTSCVTLPSLNIFRYLLRFKPDIVFTTGFNLWTAFALLLRFWKRFRVVIIYDGSSPNVDKNNSTVRLLMRRLMARFADGFITNSCAGKTYLSSVLKARESCLFFRPYQVPDVATLLASEIDVAPPLANTQRPAFIAVGEIIPGKGLHLLLEACCALRRSGYQQWTLLIVGDGPQRGELQDSIKEVGLEDHVQWAGWVNYDRLGSYFNAADVFVFPTLEDIWGMVVLEAMAFGKPILCSRWAGAAELVVHDDNGYIIDPYRPEEVASLMKQFINNPNLIQSMGERSRQKVAAHNPTAVAKHLSRVVAAVINKP